MKTKYTIVINDDVVVNILNNLPKRGKGRYITKVIKEKIMLDNKNSNKDSMLFSEKWIRELVNQEIDKRLKKDDNIQ